MFLYQESGMDLVNIETKLCVDKKVSNNIDAFEHSQQNFHRKS